MRLLLDTQIYLWFVADSARLSKAAHRDITAAEAVYVSAASVWEIAIKVALGKLRAPVGEIVEAIAKSGFLELPVRARHAARLATLPAVHRDPFDRMLVSQALEEPLMLLSADAQLSRYGDLVKLV